MSKKRKLQRKPLPPDAERKGVVVDTPGVGKQLKRLGGFGNKRS